MSIVQATLGILGLLCIIVVFHIWQAHAIPHNSFHIWDVHNIRTFRSLSSCPAKHGRRALETKDILSESLPKGTWLNGQAINLSTKPISLARKCWKPWPLEYHVPISALSNMTWLQPHPGHPRPHMTQQQCWWLTLLSMTSRVDICQTPK